MPENKVDDSSSRSDSYEEITEESETERPAGAAAEKEDSSESTSSSEEAEKEDEKWAKQSCPFCFPLKSSLSFESFLSFDSSLSIRV